MSKKVFVIGGGAAGMIAAVIAAKNGNSVTLFEKNDKLGKKLFITGKGRCNLTNACDTEDLFENIVTNKKFMYSSFYTFNNFDVIHFFEENGLKTKIERGNRVFPESDKSSDVIAMLTRALKKYKVNIVFNQVVDSVLSEGGVFQSIKLKGKNDLLHGDAVIIATGGISYQSTGSTGDGYQFAKQMGHKTTELSPALVPLVVKEPEVKELQGLSLKNIEVSILNGKRELYRNFGEMLFTHYGVSGPVILSASSLITKQLKKNPLMLSIDCKPALTEEQLDDRILRDFNEVMNCDFKNSLNHLLPKKMIPIIMKRSGIHPDKKVNSITKEERKQLIHLIKHLTFEITGLRGYEEAVITQGGIKISEINPSTMESKLIQNVYFAGEVIDVDAFTGGFNLQVAWSTGYLAGSSIEP